MKKLNDDKIKERLVCLLEKAELTPEEMQWLLNYLEREDDRELRDILYKQFQQESSSEYLSDTDGKSRLNKIQEKLYKHLFG